MESVQYDMPEKVTWTADMAEKEGYAHLMLKEIHQQPRAIKDTLLGRVTGQAGFASKPISATCTRSQL